MSGSVKTTNLTNLTKKLKMLVPLALVLLSACGTASQAVDTPPAECYFVPQLLPDISIPLDTGARSNDPADESGDIREAFRSAYAETLLRGIPLTGVLGGDRVNPWPEEAPESWSQNWAGADEKPNSWGIPALVLALMDYDGLAGTPVYSVSGAVLDQYGKSAGLNRANGAAGYGIPLGELSFSGGEAVQRFSKGEIRIGREGSRFIPGNDLVNPLIRNLSPEDREEEFGGRGIPPEVSNAFVFAWAAAFAGREWTSDGPVAHVAFPKPWILPGEGEDLLAEGLYVKSYNRGADLFVVVEGPSLPLRAHRVSGPILSVLAARRRISGLGLSTSLGRASGGGPLIQPVINSFALYGPPLSDPLPWPVEAEEEGISDMPGMPLFQEAQRFARGWIVVKPVRESEEERELPPANVEEFE